jgi:hypothetical protein
VGENIMAQIPFDGCIACYEKMLQIEQLEARINFLEKELELYRQHYARPIIIKEIIHHPTQPRDSQCLYGKSAYDEIVDR